MAVSDTYWNMAPNRKLAKHLATREVPSLVCEAVNLEGIAMTLPEVQTILDGVTVGGHEMDVHRVVPPSYRGWALFCGVDCDFGMTLLPDVIPNAERDLSL